MKTTMLFASLLALGAALAGCASPDESGEGATDTANNCPDGGMGTGTGAGGGTGDASGLDNTGDDASGLGAGSTTAGGNADCPATGVTGVEDVDDTGAGASYG